MPTLTERSMRTFYDPLEHAYYIDGVRVVSVTQALTLAGKIDRRWFTPEACARGLAVHGECEIIDKVGDGLGHRAREIAGECAAYSLFLRECRPTWKHIEAGRFHPTLRYGGRPDRIARALFGRPAVVELKTGAEHDWHRLQTALYQLLEPTGARFVVYLQKNGKYKLRRKFDAGDYREAIEALRMAQQVAA